MAWKSKRQLRQEIAGLTTDIEEYRRRRNDERNKHYKSEAQSQLARTELIGQVAAYISLDPELAKRYTREFENQDTYRTEPGIDVSQFLLDAKAEWCQRTAERLDNERKARLSGKKTED